MAHMGGVWDDARVAEYVERNTAHWDLYGFGVWVVRDPSTAVLMGLGGLRHSDVSGVDEVEVGYGFLPELWSRGLATELAQACVRVARDDLHLESVVACTSPNHAASMRVMVKAGFVFERTLALASGPAVLYRATFP